MEKQNRAELIAALVTDPYSGFMDGDEAILEAASDARLEAFRSASDNRKTAERDRVTQATALTNSQARLKVAEERLKEASQGPTEEEWLLRAPESVKKLLEAHKAEEDSFRASLVSSLKDLGANTEAELKAKSTEELKTLATYARVEIPDFSGRGVPKERNAQENTGNYAPPDPYAPHLKAMGSKAVN